MKLFRRLKNAVVTGLAYVGLVVFLIVYMIYANVWTIRYIVDVGFWPFSHPLHPFGN